MYGYLSGKLNTVSGLAVTLEPFKARGGAGNNVNLTTLGCNSNNNYTVLIPRLVNAFFSVHVRSSVVLN